MRSKNSKALTNAERAHLARVKVSACVLCGQGPPSEAHHVKQGRHFATVALCQECHRGSLGVHGDKTMQRLTKMDDIDMINETVRRAYG